MTQPNYGDTNGGRRTIRWPWKLDREDDVAFERMDGWLAGLSTGILIGALVVGLVLLVLA